MKPCVNIKVLVVIDGEVVESIDANDMDEVRVDEPVDLIAALSVSAAESIKHEVSRVMRQKGA